MNSKLKIFRKITCSCLLIVFSFQTGSAQNFIQIQNSLTYDLQGNIYYYTESNHQKNFATIVSLYNAGKFKLLKNRRGSHFKLTDPYKIHWLCIPLENLSTSNVRLTIEMITTKKNIVEIFLISETKELLERQFISGYNYQKAASVQSTLIADINTRGQLKQMIYLRVASQDLPFYITDKVVQADHYQQINSQKNRLFGIFEGIILFLIVFNIFTFLTTADKSYLFYSVYILFIGLFALNESGMITQNTFGIFQNLNFLTSPFFLFIGLAAWLMLVFHFLKVDTQPSRFKKSFYAVIASNIVIAVIEPLPILFNLQYTAGTLDILFYLYFLCFLVDVFVVLLIIYDRIQQKDRLSIFYLIANTPFILGFFIYQLDNFGAIEISLNIPNSIVIGLTIEAFLLSFGFAYRYYREKIEREELLVKSMEYQQQVAKEILLTQETERTRIARDLHDTLGSQLASLKLNFDKLDLKENGSQLIRLLDEASNSVRSISHNLMPPEFEQTDLNGLLRFKFLSIENNVTRFDLQIFNYKKQRRDLELAMYRIIMELVHNIIKHASASAATFQLTYFENEIAIIAEDNGIGFQSPENNHGIGLNNIQARVNYYQGSMFIDTGPKGSTIIIKIPC